MVVIWQLSVLWLSGDPLLEVNDSRGFKRKLPPPSWWLCLWKTSVIGITVLGCLVLAAWAFMALCYPPGHAVEVGTIYQMKSLATSWPHNHSANGLDMNLPPLS